MAANLHTIVYEPPADDLELFIVKAEKFSDHAARYRGPMTNRLKHILTKLVTQISKDYALPRQGIFVYPKSELSSVDEYSSAEYVQKNWTNSLSSKKHSFGGGPGTSESDDHIDKEKVQCDFSFKHGEFFSCDF